MSAFNRHVLATRLRAWKSTADAVMTGVAHRIMGGPVPVPILLLSDELAYTSEQQFAPLWRHAGALRRRYGVVLRHLPIGRAVSLSERQLKGVRVVGLKLSFHTPAAEARVIVASVRQALPNNGPRLIYFDGDDDACIQWPDVLDMSDVYVKKHVFADLDDYARGYAGKSNLTDFVSREFGRSFADNEIRSTAPIGKQRLADLWLGWNIGLDDKIATLAAQTAPVDADSKDIDISSRASVSPEVWIHPLRSPALDQIEAMAQRFRVLAPRERVSQQQYYDEMRRARICVSPFGYGELCWRDFEAVLCGCLLVKPDMSHLRTWPNLFVDGETYAAVRWDYSDLEAVCARYLADEDARRRVADRSRQLLLAALSEATFLDRFGGLLERAGILHRPG